MKLRFFLGILLFFIPCYNLYSQIVNGKVQLPDKLERNQQLILKGEVAFFWNKLHDPGTNFDSLQPEFAQFPGLWKPDKHNPDMRNQGFATYRLILESNMDMPDLGIFIDHMYCAYAIYLNGDLIGKNGHVGGSPKLHTPTFLPGTISFPIVKGKNELILQVENYFHSKGGIRNELVLGDFDYLQSKYHRYIAFDLLLSGSLIMGGLFFIGLFLFGRNDPALLFFSLFCLIYGYRISATDLYALHFVYPYISWFVALKLEYLSLYLSVGLFGVYTQKLYPDETQDKVIPVFTGISVVLLLFTLISKPYLYTQIIQYYIVIILGYILYGIYVYLKAWQHNRDGAIYAMMSTAVLFFVSIYLITSYLFVFTSNPIVIFTGHLLFFFLQSLILSFRFSKKLKTATIQAQAASAAKADFLSVITHEMRTPLNGILGITRFMKFDEESNEKRKNLDLIESSGQNMLSMVENILEYINLDSEHITIDSKPTSIKAMFEKLKNSFLTKAHEKGLDFDYEVDENIPDELKMDGEKLFVILYNLIDNGIKFTNKGKVNYKVKISDQRASHLVLHFTVNDTGIGISEEKQQLIFNSFTQMEGGSKRKYGGTGIGLSVACRLLEALGTTLELSSKQDIGTTLQFNVSLESKRNK